MAISVSAMNQLLRKGTGTQKPSKKPVFKKKTTKESASKPARVREAVSPERQTSRTETFTFTSTRIREASVNADGNGGQAVCLMLVEGPGNKADNHFYSEQCIVEAAATGVFEGAQAYLDHPTSVEDRIRPERSVRDLVGYWTDVHTESLTENGQQRLALVGTFKVEAGAEFVLNKLKEAKEYNEKYPNGSYIGFSINASGLSHPEEIDGKTYHVVDKITEAVSTDMVTRAGAGGKLLNLKEAMRMSKIQKPTGLDAKAKKVLEAQVSITTRKVLESLKAGGLLKEAASDDVRKKVAEALEKAGIDVEAANKALDEAFGQAKEDDAEEATEESEEDDADEDGDDDVADDEQDAADDTEDTEDEDTEESDDMEEDGDMEEDDAEEAVEGNKTIEALENAVKEAKKGKAPAAVVESLKGALKEARKTITTLTTRESLRQASDNADKVIESLKVPAKARAFVKQELMECKTTKAMRERATTLMDTIIKPLYESTKRSSVSGNVSGNRGLRESGGGLISLTEV